MEVEVTTRILGYRQVLDDCIEDIKKLLILCFPGDYKSSEELPNSQFIEVVSGFYGKEKCNWILMYLPDLLIGVVSYVSLYNSIYVFNLGVHPEYQNQGKAQRLLRLCRHQARVKGLYKLTGLVDGSKTQLVQYYSKRGAIDCSVNINSTEEKKMLRNIHSESDSVDEET